MTYDQLAAFFDGPTKTAAALGIRSRQTVHSWRDLGIPPKWQLEAERISGGKLKADAAARRLAHEYASYVRA